MKELWQLYDEQGRPLKGRGAGKEEVFKEGILHGASHVWIWRRDSSGQVEILLQKRAANKRTWPNRYDISAAGHIDLGETPIEAALREAKEEINLDIDSNDLKLLGVHRAYMQAENGAIENEFQWLYSLEISGELELNLQDSEVESVSWIPMNRFKAECSGDNHVPHGRPYYDTLIESLDRV